jgi:hypothetical protein
VFSTLRDLVSRKVLQGEGWKNKFRLDLDVSAVESWLDRYATVAERLHASTRINGGKALFTVQLELSGERLKQFTPEEKRMYDYYSYYRRLHTDIRDRLVARMSSLGAENRIWFLDISDAFRNEKEQTYLDYTHLTSRGANVVAQRLAAAVEPEMLSDRFGHRSTVGK